MQTPVFAPFTLNAKKSIDGFGHILNIALRKYAFPAVLPDVSFPSLLRQEPTRAVPPFYFSVVSSWRVTASSPKLSDSFGLKTTPRRANLSPPPFFPRPVLRA
jgi:hypothetical protein